MSPDWNEAGIVYQAKPGSRLPRIRRMAARVVVIQEGWILDPDWQPGGGRIVYQSKEGSHWQFSASTRMAAMCMP